MYDWDDLIDELRDDLAHDLGRGVMPPTLAVGYDGPHAAVALQAPPFAIEDADAIIRRILGVFGPFTLLRRFAASWPARYELPGPDGDELRSSDGGVWALLITRGELDDRDRARWRCSLLGYRFERGVGIVDVADETHDVDLAQLANPFPRRLRPILDRRRHERFLADPYLDARTLEDDGYYLAIRPDVAAQLQPVDEDTVVEIGGRVWPASMLS